MSNKQQVIEARGLTVEEAIAAGLSKLGVSRDRVDIEVLDEGRRGLLGIGGRDAVVRLSIKAAPAKPAPPPKPAPEPKPAPPPKQARPAPQAKPAPKPQQAPQPKPARPRPSAPATGAEAETAVRVIDDLLQKMQVVATVSAGLTEPDELSGEQLTVINIEGDDLGTLIGARGETMDALQHVARLMVGNELQTRTHFVVDVEGYRARREQALARMAERMADKAIKRGEPVTLEPMPAYERRIIHMTIRQMDGARTESTGEGDRRRVRIYPT